MTVPGTTDADESPVRASDLPVRERAVGQALFLIAYGATLAGVAMSLVDATAATTRAGGSSNGGIYTSVYIATLLLSSAIAIAQAPAVAARFGSRRTLIATTTAASGLWAVIGTLVIADFEPMTVLVTGAVAAGAFSGVFTALIPLFAKAYLRDLDMAAAYARLSVPTGISWTVGAAAGGLILHRVDPGWGLVARAALSLPLVALVLLRPTAVEPEAPAPTAGAWADMRDRLGRNVELRRTVLLGCGVSLLAAPMLTLIVPIADALMQRPLIPGASTLIVAMSLGQMLAPLVVKALGNGRGHLRAAAWAALATGATIAIYGLSAFALSGTSELVVWALIGLAFGALNFGGGSLTIGAATDSDTEANAGAMVSTYLFATTLAAPVGVLLWGLLISRASVETAVLTGAAGTAAVAVAVLWRSQADGRSGG